jgi:hypothetical protein
MTAQAAAVAILGLMFGLWLAIVIPARDRSDARQEVQQTPRLSPSVQFARVCGASASRQVNRAVKCDRFIHWRYSLGRVHQPRVTRPCPPENPAFPDIYASTNHPNCCSQTGKQGR